MGKSTQVQIPKKISMIISPSLRYVVCEWIYRVSEKVYGRGDVARRAFYSTVVSLDVALFSTAAEQFPFPIGGPKLQLTALACFMYGVRYLYQRQQVPKIPDVDKLMTLGQINDSLSNFFLLCNALDRINPLANHESPLQVFDQFNEQPQMPSGTFPAITENLKKYSLVLIDSYLLDYPYVKYPVQLIVQSALLLAQEIATHNRLMTNQLASSDFSLGACYRDIFLSAKRLFCARTKNENHKSSSGQPTISSDKQQPQSSTSELSKKRKLTEIKDGSNCRDEENGHKKLKHSEICT